MDATLPRANRDDDPEKTVARSGNAEARREARWAAWREENAEAIASWNAYINEQGLPLARYRQF